MTPHADRWTAQWHIGDAALRDAALWTRWEQTRQGASGAQVFHRPALLRSWYDTVGRACASEPAIGEFVSSSGHHAYLAAAITPYRGRVVHRAICEPAGQELFGYHDPLAAAALSPRQWDGFWATVRASLATNCDVGLFRFVHSEYAGVQSSEAAGDGSPVVPLSGAASLDDVLARCSANHRGDVRRRLRRLADRGRVELRVFDVEHLDDARVECLRHFLPAWGLRHADAQARPSLPSFCETVVVTGLREGFCHFSALQVDGISIAWHLGLCDEGRLYWWMPVHAAEWDAYSPGKVLLALLVDRLARERWLELHFQTGRQPYKLAWRPQEPQLSAVRWHAPSLKGRLLAGYDLTRAAR